MQSQIIKRMAKHKFLLSKENRISFFLNFLAVVLGIVITFGGESIVSHKEERNNLHNCLELVSIELQEDKECIRYCDTLIVRELEAALYLMKYEDDYARAPLDSLYAVANTPFLLEEINVYEDAFDLLKNSGVLTKIKDKQLALDIFKTYDALKGVVFFLNSYYGHKTKYLELAMTDDVKAILASETVGAVELWSAITSTKEGKQYLREILRFLSTYDPSGVYDSIDSTVEEIQAFIR